MADELGRKPLAFEINYIMGAFQAGHLGTQTAREAHPIGALP